MITKEQLSKTALLLLIAGGTVANAQTVNNWKGGEEGADWNDKYKWERRHPPSGEEAAHFREANTLVNVNSTVQLNNGMHIYKEVSLQGNGNINMQNPVPHLRTVNIPASATGFANMTLNDNISLNGRVALSAKGFGTSASKGSITLKDRSNVTGDLRIGNAGTGTGQVFVQGSSTYRITALELATEAKEGGSAEIHVLGGTVRIETKNNPFDAFLKDASRKLIVGDAGTVRIEYNMPVSEKKEALKKMIKGDRIVAAPGCRLTPPVIQNKMVILRAEDERNETDIKTKEDLIAAIDKVSDGTSLTGGGSSSQQGLNALLLNMQSGSRPSTSPGITTTTTSSSSGTKLAGYIVFFGGVLLVLRRAPAEKSGE
jgi:hypothetical protein